MGISESGRRRSVATLAPEVAVLLNVDLDHHTEFVSRAELIDFFEVFMEMVAQLKRRQAEEVKILDDAMVEAKARVAFVGPTMDWPLTGCTKPATL